MLPVYVLYYEIYCEPQKHFHPLVEAVFRNILGKTGQPTNSIFLVGKDSGHFLKHVVLYQVPITFLPRDRGDYAQFWDLECHPVSETQQKHRIRFQLSGMVRTDL